MFNEIIGVIQIAFGVIFALSMKTDIQFGFAVILITLGLKNIINK